MLRLLLFIFRRNHHFLTDIVAASSLTPQQWRKEIYRHVGISIEETHRAVNIGPRCRIVGNELSIKSGTFINSDCFFHARAPIVIEEDCALAMEVMICTISHEVGPWNWRCGNTKFAPVTIGAGSWIGTRATILQGVTVGKGCIIAAGAVVTHDCEPNGMYAGVPARRVRDLPLHQPILDTAPS